MKHPKGSMPPPALPNISLEMLNDRIDMESVMGKFGWEKIDKFDLPYIIRKGEKYTAIRIAEQKLLQQFKVLYNKEVYSCFSINQVHLTDAEVRLLNEINVFHCNGLFGNYPFTVNDFLLKLKDVELLYELFVFIKNAADDKVDMERARCGFIQMDDQPPVPYVSVDGVKYSPMFYFEGAAEYLENQATYLTGWDLSYLKFCCKVQGIRQEFYAAEKCQVVGFEEIKKFLPPETKYTMIWPKNIVQHFFWKLQTEKSKQQQQQQQQSNRTKYPQSTVLSTKNNPMPPADYLSAYNLFNQHMFQTHNYQNVHNYSVPQNR